VKIRKAGGVGQAKGDVAGREGDSNKKALEKPVDKDDTNTGV